MKKVLITGVEGFIGRNLYLALTRDQDAQIFPYDVGFEPQQLEEALDEVDLVYHLAGVNRPITNEEFFSGNVGFTSELVGRLKAKRRKPTIVFSSTIQAELDNPYGRSKQAAEEALIQYGKETGARVIIYRLPNVFGKWSRPNYNSAVATFCYNLSRKLPIIVSDEARELSLVYIDDVVHTMAAVLGDLENEARGVEFPEITPTYQITLGKLVELITSFGQNRETLFVPNFANKLVRKLYATYLSFIDSNSLSYPLERKEDQRGWLVEVIKAPDFGQIFVSGSHPGVIRGNHFHDTKVEKFIVVRGEAIIKLRKIDEDDPVIYPVSGGSPVVVDIPPGYTHSIENVGQEELVVLFWANEVFEPERPDTYWCEV